MSATGTTSSAPAPAALEPTVIWCVPRSCSTAFERAFMQRSDTVTFHEPTGDFAYYGKGRQNFRFTEQECQADPQRYEKGLEQIMLEIADAKGKDTNGKKFIFIKDMAQYILPTATLQALHPGSRVYHPTSPDYQPPGYRPLASENAVPLPDFSRALPPSFGRSVVRNPTALPTALLRRFKHTFLVRAPAKSVLSYYKAAQEGAGGFQYFDGAEAGYKELALLHAWIANPESDFHTGGDAAGAGAGAGAEEEDGEGHEQTKKRGVGTRVAQPMPPPLIDASTLLAEPEHVLEQYCAAIGVPFDAGMLSWESSAKKGAAGSAGAAPNGSSSSAPGEPAATEQAQGEGAQPAADGSAGAGKNDLADFAKWGTYHKAAEESTGFRKESDQQHGDGDARASGAAVEKAAGKEQKALPKEVQETVDANKYVYDYLLAHQTIQLPKKA